jgi:hypothetical protein
MSLEITKLLLIITPKILGFESQIAQHSTKHGIPPILHFPGTTQIQGVSAYPYFKTDPA